MKNKTPLISQATGKAIALGDDGFADVLYNDSTISIPFCLPGETINFEIVQYAKRTNHYFKDVIKPSQERQIPDCPHFTVCGGCILQHATPHFYQEFKLSLLQKALQKQQLDPYIIQPLQVVTTGQRRRANLEAIKKGDKLFMGFHRLKSHQIVDIKHCPVLTTPLQQALPFLRNALEKILEPFQKAQLFLLEINNIVDIAIEIQGVKTLTPNQEEILKNIAIKAKWHRLQFRHSKKYQILHQTQNITATFGHIEVEVDPWSFMQASTTAEQWLQDIIKTTLQQSTPHTKLLDLFSGRGTFTGVMLPFAPVTAVESDARAFNSLANAALQSPSLHVIRQDLFTQPMLADQLKIYSAVVIDPPRAGAQYQSEQLAKSEVPLIIYISCNPQTFARDAKILEEGGFHLEKAYPIDQFLWSSHLEVVGVFKKNPQ